MYQGEIKQYTKSEAIKVIIQGAKLYKANLENRELLFLCKSPSKNVSYYKVDFNNWNYLHFTGVETSLKAAVFYKKALNNTLKASDFKYKD
ncbi:MAG: PBECR4 domain-containing protein, partial [Eubacterium sp.]|nr:PBECR4 domain-containing protein [Eubacterium sp.]